MRTKSFLRQATERLVESSSPRASVGGSGGGVEVDEHEFLCRELARQTARADEWKANGILLAQVRSLDPFVTAKGRLCNYAHPL